LILILLEDVMRNDPDEVKATASWLQFAALVAIAVSVFGILVFDAARKDMLARAAAKSAPTVIAR
jgi:hypothetical protein